MKHHIQFISQNVHGTQYSSIFLCRNAKNKHPHKEVRRNIMHTIYSPPTGKSFVSKFDIRP